MERRKFVKLLGATAAGWSFAARAQQPVRMRRIGVLMNFLASDPESSIGTSAFEHGLAERGWKLGANLQIEYRWANYGALYTKFAEELVALTPDVIVAVGSSSATALQEVTRSIPIVFIKSSDPVNRKLIATMEKPGGNFTGLIEFEPSIGKKWLELLNQIAPTVTRVAIIQDPSRFAWRNVLTAIEKATPTFNVTTTPVDTRNGLAMMRTLTAFASSPHGGLIVTPSTFSVLMRGQIVALATQHKLPAIYFSQFFVNDGGLASYAPDTVDEYRTAATYVDRILKGERPPNMPVQAPAKFDFVINLRAAQAIGLNIPPDVLTLANHVVQ